MLSLQLHEKSSTPLEGFNDHPRHIISEYIEEANEVRDNALTEEFRSEMKIAMEFYRKEDEDEVTSTCLAGSKYLRMHSGNPKKRRLYCSAELDVPKEVSENSLMEADLENHTFVPEVHLKHNSFRRKMNENDEKLSIQAFPLRNFGPKIPRHSSTIYLRRNFFCEDDQTIPSIPYLGDNDVDYEAAMELLDKDLRERILEFGASYNQFRSMEIVDKVLHKIYAGLKHIPEGSKKALAEGTKIKLSTIEERCKLLFFENHEEFPPLETYNESDENIGSADNDKPTTDRRALASKVATAANEKACLFNSETTDELPYESLADSFRSLFCRRCFTYDCNIHGNLDKPDTNIMAELALLKENSGGWKQCQVAGSGNKANVSNGNMESSDLDPSDGTTRIKEKPSIENNANLIYASIDIGSGYKVNASDGNVESFDHDPNDRTTRIREKTSIENNVNLIGASFDIGVFSRSICKRAYEVFDGNVKAIAQALSEDFENLNLLCNERRYSKVEFKCHEIIQKKFDNKPHSKKGVLKSMNSYNQTWLNRIAQTEIYPTFAPCSHEGPCNESCSCVKNAFFCTKHCIWGQHSRNFFRGCACERGKCNTNSCSCFAAKRECDPDVCMMCNTCSDPLGKRTENQRCQNDKIGMCRRARVIVAKSTIEGAGWGLFNKEALIKGDFVDEYVGELISQEEADRRGIVYDQVNRSYLFNVTTDHVLDASRKGNKARFANHSDKANCVTKTVNVNGDLRIGLFAKEDIPPQSELFFDYRYDKKIEFEWFSKPATNVSWMMKGKSKVASKGSS